MNNSIHIVKIDTNYVKFIFKSKEITLKIDGKVSLLNDKLNYQFGIDNHSIISIESFSLAVTNIEDLLYMGLTNLPYIVHYIMENVTDKWVNLKLQEKIDFANAVSSNSKLYS